MSGRVLELLGPSAGGIRRHVATLADGLAAEGWQATVAGPPGAMDGVGRQDFDIAVGLDPRGLPASLRALRQHSRGADLIHAHGLKAGWLASLLPAGPPVVLTVHNLVLDDAAGRAAWALRHAESWLPRRMAATIVVSPEIARRFSGCAGADRIHVIIPASPPPIATRTAAEIRAVLGIDAAVPLAVTVARLHPQKAVGDLLVCWPAVLARVPGAVLAVVGDGPERADLETRAAALHLGSSVRFTGFQTDGASWLAAADAVVVSSIWEGSPVVVAEALQLGAPLVTTDVGDVAEIVDDGRTGRLVAPRDRAGLGSALADLLADPAAARSMAAAGQAAAISRYGSAKLVAAVADLYERTLQEHA